MGTCPRVLDESFLACRKVIALLAYLAVNDVPHTQKIFPRGAKHLIAAQLRAGKSRAMAMSHFRMVMMMAKNVVGGSH